MPPRKGESSTRTVRRPPRAAVIAAAVPADPPPITITSASARSGTRSSGNATVAGTSGLGCRLGHARGGHLPDALGDRRHRLQQHVEPGDVWTRPGGQDLTVDAECLVELVFLAGR